MQKLAAQTARVDAATERGAFTLHVKAEERDKQGKVTSTTEEVQRIRHQDGRAQIEVVRAVKNGKDMTDLERRETARQQSKGKKPPKGRMDSPFAADQQASYAFTFVPASAPHTARIQFTPRVSPTEKLYRGQAQVDTEAGAVLSIKMSPAKLPSHADRVDISLDFAAPGHLLSKMVVDGEGSFLFLHKHMIVTSAFSDYQ